MRRVDAAAAQATRAGDGERALADEQQPWGRYTIYGEIAAGGMATIEYGRLLGPRGFQRPVAIKRLHPQLARDPELVAMFVDEARMSSRLHHANLVPTLDVIEGPGELALVMEYVHGVALSSLFTLGRARGEPFPVRIAVSLLSGVLHGLHAAHETCDERGVPMQLVHRDVSPHNVLVGADGVPRVLDFGVAKALGRQRMTPSGEVKGKLAYIAPEQLRGGPVDRRADVYGASVVLWEALTGRQLFDGPNDSALMHAVLHGPVPPPSSENPLVSPALDAIVLHGLARSPDERFASARELAVALERAVGVDTQSDVADWLEQLAGEQLAARARTVQQLQDEAEQRGDDGTRPLPAQGTRKLEPGDEADRDSSHIEKRLPGARRHVLPIAVLAAVLLLALLAWSQRERFAAPESVPVSARSTERAQPAQSPEPEPEPEPEPGSGSGSETVPELGSEPEPGSKPGRAHVPAAAVTPPAPGEVVTVPAQPAAQVPPARTRAQASKNGAASRKGKRAVDCVPPYVIDRAGIRHPKPECL